MTAVVAIVYAIINCLKRAGTAFPKYIPIPSTTTTRIEHSSETSITIPDSTSEHPTMERFIIDMAKEKPVRFSPEQLNVFSDNYSTILGSGGFGVVFKGELPNGIKVAIKVLTSNVDKRIDEQFMAEVGTIGRTYHINLVRLFGFCFSSSTRALVYEYMENGSLDRLLFNRNQSSVIEWEKLHGIAVGTAKGLAYLHEECERRIIHYDIKPGNILLDGNLNPKVSDFGLAKLCVRERTDRGILMTGCRGTPGYAAPELWKPYPVTHKCDVYSFGILLFEILGRRRHNDAEGDSINESLEWLPKWTWSKFEGGEITDVLSGWGIEEKDRVKAERMVAVALWCVQYSAESRPLMSNVVKMLEEGMEIGVPPYPFEHLQTLGAKLESSDDDWSSSNVSSSKSITKAFEIEEVC